MRDARRFLHVAVQCDIHHAAAARGGDCGSGCRTRYITSIPWCCRMLSSSLPPSLLAANCPAPPPPLTPCLLLSFSFSSSSHHSLLLSSSPPSPLTFCCFNICFTALHPPHLPAPLLLCPLSRSAVSEGSGKATHRGSTGGQPFTRTHVCCALCSDAHSTHPPHLISISTTSFPTFPFSLAPGLRSCGNGLCRAMQGGWVSRYPLKISFYPSSIKRSVSYLQLVLQH